LLSTGWAGTSIGGGGTGIFNQRGGAHDVSGGLNLGIAPGSDGTYNFHGGTLSVGGLEQVADQGTGTFNQWVGTTHTVGGDLILGNNHGSNGTFNLNGGSLTVGGFEFIGMNGTGFFKQSGGTHTVTSDSSQYGALVLGGEIGGYGKYEMNDGTLTTNFLQIGRSGNGDFVQTGGTVNVNQYVPPDPNNPGGGVNLGQVFGRTGTYDLSGTGVLNAQSILVGADGKGIFNQWSGTTVSVTEGVVLAGNTSGTGDGTYNLKGGDLISGNTQVGAWGTGTFNQDGGTHTANGGYGALVLGGGSTGIGTYNLNSGKLEGTFEEYIGGEGQGYFYQRGGMHVLNGALYVAAGAGYGEYHMIDGELKAGPGGGGIILGEWGGKGEFYHSGGSVTVNSLQLARQNFSNGYYELSGTGQLTVEGNVDFGVRGDGYFKQKGGTNQVNGTLTISVNPGTSTGTYEMSGGTLNAGNIINNGIFNFTGGDVITSLMKNYGLFKGGGTSFTGSVINYGTVSPGSSPGTLTISGDYTQDALGALLIELGGTTQGTNYDFLKITGTATLVGLLDVDLYGGFIPQAGNVFEILEAQSGISGTFGSYDLPYGINYWDITYGSNIVSLEYLGGGQPVPVPSILLLLGTGLIGLAGLMRRKLKR
jgi:fibronectin-binding autotransporter adhesin